MRFLLSFAFLVSLSFTTVNAVPIDQLQQKVYLNKAEEQGSGAFIQAAKATQNPATITCGCDNPNSVFVNTFTCQDKTKGSCPSGWLCTATSSFYKTTLVTQDSPCKLQCSCDRNTLTDQTSSFYQKDPKINCHDGSSFQCGLIPNTKNSRQTCTYGQTFFHDNIPSNLCSAQSYPFCWCVNPFATGSNMNKYVCYDGTSGYGTAWNYACSNTGLFTLDTVQDQFVPQPTCVASGQTCTRPDSSGNLNGALPCCQGYSCKLNLPTQQTVAGGWINVPPNIPDYFSGANYYCQ